MEQWKFWVPYIPFIKPMIKKYEMPFSVLHWYVIFVKMHGTIETGLKPTHFQIFLYLSYLRKKQDCSQITLKLKDTHIHNWFSTPLQYILRILLFIIYYVYMYM